MNSYKNWGFGSLCVHSGKVAESNYAHVTPIYATSTFTFDTAEQAQNRISHKEEGYIYTRFGNPTFTEAEQKIAAIECYGLTDENGKPMEAKAILHASGMAALTTLFLSTLKAGDKVVTHPSLYGGTNGLLNKVFSGLGVEIIELDMHDLGKVESVLEQETSIQLMYLETPANPTLRCVDLEKLISLARKYHITSAVDNTFATAYLQQPFAYGADFVFHSTTKYLNGHGSSVGGVLIGRDPERMSLVKKIHVIAGGNSSPFDAYLLIQGIRTMELRMERHCDNAEKTALFLDQNPAVAVVNYPGLKTHPDYVIAQKQMKRPGAMMSFELKGGLEAGKKFMNSLRFCTRAVSLGTCDTLVAHPASTTHAEVPKEQREAAGISDGLIRISIGIENVEDILADLEQALG